MDPVDFNSATCGVPTPTHPSVLSCLLASSKAVLGSWETYLYRRGEQFPARVSTKNSIQHKKGAYFTDT